MIRVLDLRFNVTCSLNDINNQNNGDYAYIFLHFRQNTVITINDNAYKIPLGSFIIYRFDNEIYKFDNTPIHHDWIALSDDVLDFLKQINLKTDTIYFSHYTKHSAEDIKQIEIEFYRHSMHSETIIDMESKLLFYKLQRQIPGAPLIGTNAKKLLKNYDFENTWKTTDTYPALTIFDNKRQPSNYWTGKVTKPTIETDGIIHINSPEELAWVILNGGNNHYQLTKDIYLNDTTKFDWQSGEHSEDYTPNNWFNGDNLPEFNGTLDGNGHIIYGLYYNTRERNPLFDEWSNIGCGLVPVMGTAIIKNIGIKYAYLNFYDNYSLGAIVGKTQRTGSGKIQGCFVDETVTLCGYDVGGIVGGGNPKGSIYIENCFSFATLIADRYSGEIIGHSWTQNVWFVEKCFCFGQPYGAFWRFPYAKDVYCTLKNPNMNKQVIEHPDLIQISSDVSEQLIALREKMFSTLNEKWDIKRLATEMHVSESTLCKYYTAYFGCSPIANLIRRKIDVAKHLLTTSNETIKEISYKLGYENTTHFCRQFKSIIGMSPSTYRSETNAIKQN